MLWGSAWWRSRPGQRLPFNTHIPDLLGIESFIHILSLSLRSLGKSLDQKRHSSRRPRARVGKGRIVDNLVLEGYLKEVHRIGIAADTWSERRRPGGRKVDNQVLLPQ